MTDAVVSPVSLASSPALSGPCWASRWTQRRSVALTPIRAAAPWLIEDLAAHLAASIHDGLLRFAGSLVLARFDVDRHNLTRAAAWSRRTPEELLAVLATDRVPLILRLNPALVVVDNVVHHQDLRRPLGLPLDVPTAHLRAALQSVMSLRVFAADAARVAGYRLVATDLDWQHGSGPELRGPAEALLMTIMGRDVGLSVSNRTPAEADTSTWWSSMNGSNGLMWWLSRRGGNRRPDQDS